MAGVSIPRAALLLIVPLLSTAGRAFSQALPAGEAAPISTGFALPSTQGSLRYSLGAYEGISSGYYGSGTTSSTGVNGSLALISSSQLDPFSLVFSAGDSWNSDGGPSTYFLNMGVSQVINTRNWNFILSDSVGYLPETPSVGLSGVPGTGDVGISPIQVGADSSQGVLTQYSSRVSNAATIGAGLHLTGKTTLQFSGSYSGLYFLGDSVNEINSSTESGSAGISHRIDARSNVSGTYSYSRFTYGTNQPTVVSQTVAISYSHQFSRRFGMSVSSGPQWSNFTDTVPYVPSTVNLFVAAAATYSTLNTSYGLSYSRGTNSGSGIIEGAESDSVGFHVSRTFDRVWNTSASASYTRTTALDTNINSNQFAPQTIVGAVQVSRALARSLSAYGSYTLEDQTSQGTAAGTAVFSGLYKVAAFGITYSPGAIHFGPR
jgi:hypothetical protein